MSEEIKKEDEITEDAPIEEAEEESSEESEE